MKPKSELKNKGQALGKIKRYEECELELELKPEFVKEIEETCKHGKFVKVKDFAEEFNIQRLWKT